MAWTLMTLFRIPNRWYHLRHHNYDFRESAECMHCMNLLISKRGPAGTAFCQEDPHLLKEWLTWCCSGKNPLVEQWFFGIQCQTRELRPVRAHPTNHLKKKHHRKTTRMHRTSRNHRNQPGCIDPAGSRSQPTRRRRESEATLSYLLIIVVPISFSGVKRVYKYKAT